MKRLFLPIALLSFAVICLSIVHLENINKLDKESTELQQKLSKIKQQSTTGVSDHESNPK
ncbi:hypothetical protein ACJRPK_05605 [Aquimarina sp. 2-A2]|uniref:hypothetical protein n=1 Tax=Aquimarina sp. 2-A2 TaxID=3382644 RepID=UPI00387EE8E4